MNNNPQTRGNLPKYVQVSELLIRDIYSGRRLDGDRLPSEKVLAKNLGVSVGTLRRSLTQLAEKKLLKRVQGSGNYICYENGAYSIYGMFRLELHEGGGLPSAKIIDLKFLSKPKTFPVFGSSDFGTRVRRLRYLNDIIIALEEIWLDSESGSLRREDLNDSMYQSYYKIHGIWISHVEDRVSIGKVPNWAPKECNFSRGAMFGYVERFGWAAASYPIEYSRTWFDTKRAHYVQRMR